LVSEGRRSEVVIGFVLPDSDATLFFPLFLLFIPFLFLEVLVLLPLFLCPDFSGPLFVIRHA
jgi:hypothetical protein